VLRSIELEPVNPVGSGETEPGRNCVSVEKFGPFNGILAIISDEKVSPSVAFSALRIGLSSELHIDGRDLIDLQPERSLGCSIETRRAYPDGIGSNRQKRKVVQAVAVAGCVADDSGGRVRDAHLGIFHDRSAGIGDDTAH